MGLSNMAKRLLGKNGINMNHFLPTGEQYCPYCHTLTAHRSEGYYECDICNYSITDEEAIEAFKIFRASSKVKTPSPS